jgi:protein gp37
LPERLYQPLKWRKPRRVFVNSMSDLFHADVPDGFIDRVFRTIAYSPQHTFLILTKRPERMYEWTRNMRSLVVMLQHWKREQAGQNTWPLPNVWLGVSIEDQATADERIPFLLKTPAAVRFVSAEPLLGPVDLNVRWLEDQCDQCSRTIPRNIHGCYNPYNGDDDCDGSPSGNPLLDWVIAGGETGPGARPAHPDWFRGLRDQCHAAGVAYFFKRHGAGNDSRLLDGVEHNAYPEGNHA